MITWGKTLLPEEKPSELVDQVIALQEDGPAGHDIGSGLAGASRRSGSQRREIRMRALIQKPSRASVTVDDRAVGKIGAGLIIFGAGMEVALVNDGR